MQFKTLFCNRTHCQNACSLEKNRNEENVVLTLEFFDESRGRVVSCIAIKNCARLLNDAICFSWALRKVECTAWSALESKKAITVTLPFISAKLDSYWLVPDIVTRCESLHE